MHVLKEFINSQTRNVYRKYSTNKPWGCIKLNGVKTGIQDNSSRDYSRHNSSRDKSTNSFSSRPNTSHRNTPHDENWYRNYFKEHLNELDPIEGIYSVSSLISSVNVYNKSYSEEDIFTVVIIKKIMKNFLRLNHFLITIMEIVR